MRTATVTVGEGPTVHDVASALQRTLGVAGEEAGAEVEFEVGDALWVLADFTEEYDPGAAYALDLVGPGSIQDSESRRVFDALVASTNWWVQLWADDNRVLVAERRPAA